MKDTHKIALAALAFGAVRCNGTTTTDAGPDVAADISTDTGSDVVANDTVDATVDVQPPDVQDVSTPDTSTDAGTDAESPACDGWMALPTVPAAIAVPDGGTLLLHAAGSGTQDYACTATAVDGGTGDSGSDAGETYAWTLVGPMATLSDCNGTAIGMHFTEPAGPTWQTTDGTSVSGMRIASATATAPNSIPWLLLHAVAHSGTGTLSNVQYVQRVNTLDGVAPATGCDSASVGATQNVEYTADYYYYGM